MNKYLIGAVIVIVISIAVWAFTAIAPTSSSLRGVTYSPPINYATTNASTTCSGAVSAVLSANSALTFRSITNIGTNTAYLWESATSTGFTSANAGIPLYGSTTFSMAEDQGNLWRGTIFCLASATTTLSYTQW